MTEQRDCEMYIDGDGVPFWMMELAIRNTRARFKTVRVRVYKDWTNTGNHRLMESLWALKVDLVQVTPHATLKNGTDIAIAVDAVETHHMSPTQSVALVGNDGDFTALARHLKHKGITVIGFGATDASEQLGDACAQFVRFDTVTRAPSSCFGRDPQLDDKIADVIADCVDEHGWTPLVRFGYVVLNKYGIRPKDVGAKTWSHYFRSNQTFECAIAENGYASVRAKLLSHAA